jgi:hypothetical protein
MEGLNHMDKKSEIVTAPAPRELLPLKPVNVIVNAVNHASKSIIVHVPENLTLQDITDHPALWRTVQQNRDKALSEGDSVELRWHDQIAFTYVDHAADGEVYFLKPQVYRRRERDRTPWQNSTYEVRAINGQYSYFRKKDGIRMTTASWPTWEGAKAACEREQSPARL